ncbi:ubiquinone/menaquinone biosynthesis C-methylase UbiE [Motilibacter rhizosphaerae]|uniref:Ubiquinone/menaquinone biosynthesis C-methylase UbiE n=1 Tax=Motilibacter rhizosphaerae TaxID=598652 RepID=A0A4Q7NVV8_9ACTN|nr:ubiquinone/menaquinone biosynthesis C-methylase UbiE [Motilibacter rhizosphaerae]
MQRAYGRLATAYIDLFGMIEQLHPDDVDLVVRHLGNLEGPVLDIGCGPGHYTAHLRALGVDARGIDLVPEFVAHARAAHPGVPYELGSMLDLPAPTGSLSGVLAWYSTIHLDDGQFALALGEFRRVLQTDGLLVLGFFDGIEHDAFAHKVVPAWRWPVDQLAERLSGNGFVEIERQQRDASDDVRAHAALVLRRAD